MGKANPFTYGILGGIGGYAEGAARDAEYGQRLAEQSALRMEQERLRQQDRLELARERAALSGSRSRGDGDDVFDPEVAEKQYRFATGMTPEEEAGVRSGEAFVTQRIKQFNADGSSSVVSEQRMDGWQALQSQKIAELDAIRKNVAFGKHAKTAAEAESEYQNVDMAEGVRGQRGDYAGLLAKQGKGLYDSAGESGAINVETGESKLNALGTAKARSEGAEAGWYDRRTSGDSADAEGRRDLNAQRILIKSKLDTLQEKLKNGQASKEQGGRPAVLQQIAALEQQLLQLGSAPGKGGGKTITTKGGRTVTVLED